MELLHLTLVTYNIHHAAGMDRRVDLERIADVIRDTGAHIACLQEVDCHVVRSRRANQPRELGRMLGMTPLYHPTLRWPMGQRYGNLLLTSLPMTASTTHALPGRGEPRGLIEAHLETDAGPIAVFCTHWGLPEPDRVVQACRTAEILQAVTVPLLFAGDLNEGPEGPDHQILRELGLSSLGPASGTFPAPEPVATIDHVYGSAEWRVREAYTVPSLASDHRPVVVDLTLQPAPSS